MFLKNKIKYKVCHIACTKCTGPLISNCDKTTCNASNSYYN